MYIYTHSYNTYNDSNDSYTYTCSKREPPIGNYTPKKVLWHWTILDQNPISTLVANWRIHWYASQKGWQHSFLPIEAECCWVVIPEYCRAMFDWQLHSFISSVSARSWSSNFNSTPKLRTGNLLAQSKRQLMFQDSVWQKLIMHLGNSK